MTTNSTIVPSNVTTTVAATITSTVSKILSTTILSTQRPSLSTSTMPPIATLDYTSSDSTISLIVFFNLILTCCLLLCVAYSREVFCFAKPKGNRGKGAKKNAPDLEENGDDDEEDGEDFQ